MGALSTRDCAVFVGIGSVLYVILVKPDPGYLLQLGLKGVFGLAIFTLLVNFTKSWAGRYLPASKPHEEATFSDDELKTRQEHARKEDQVKYSEKTQNYYEKITKPREDAKFKKKEEQFYRQMGQEWKLTKGEVLSQKDNGSRKGKSEGSGKEAADARKLPDHVMNPPKPPPAPVKPPKRKITMPVEPEAGTPDSVSVVLRTSQGRNHRRRFLQSQTIQDLLDFMTMVGYHQNIYQICTSYPRKCISQDKEQTLVDAGITRDMALNVEEKDDCPP